MAGGGTTNFDAIVIGAGFGGLYQVHKLRNELGLRVMAYDTASDVGGTWHWNRYPGALSDSESFVYCYSFDKQLLQDWTWKNRYVTQPEILDYLKHFADRFDLRRSYEFNTKVTAAHFNEETQLWDITTDKGDRASARFLVTALGLLSASNTPDIKGLSSFGGEQYHTSSWPIGGVDFAGKRVGIIGTGSTGTQCITSIAPLAGNLTVFQRTPQYTVPVRQRPLEQSEIEAIKESYDEIWDGVRRSSVAFGFEESTVPAFDVSSEEREQIFEKAWEFGGGFRFMFETFSDIATNVKSNEAAASFIRRKIAQIVKDPEIAAKLTPTDLYAKRPLCDSGYYETFNRDNVDLVDIKSEPIAEVTPTGIKTSENEYPLDILIFATGFDAVDGNYRRMDIKGRGGVQIAEQWKNGPTSYLGMSTSGFPNMFMILGPNGPFTNLPPTIESQVNWIADAINYMDNGGYVTMEADETSEKSWSETCQTISDMTLFSKGNSWIFGANVPGKLKSVMFYLAGLGNYLSVLNEASNSKYDGFTLHRRHQTSGERNGQS